VGPRKMGKPRQTVKGAPLKVGMPSRPAGADIHEVGVQSQTLRAHYVPRKRQSERPDTGSAAEKDVPTRLGRVKRTSTLELSGSARVESVGIPHQSA